MTFHSIREIVSAFCIDKPLTTEILNQLRIVGSLQGRKIRQILPDSSRLGHLIHRIRYCFNLCHYREDFDQAAANYLKKSSIVIQKMQEPALQRPLALPAPVAPPAPEPVIPPAPKPVAIPSPAPVPVQKQPAFTKHTEKFLGLVQENLGNQSADLWKILFTHFFERHDQDHCINFTSHRKSHFLHFSQPLVIHMNPLDQDRKPVPEGGLILTFGRKGTVEFEIQSGSIQFKSGVTGLAKVPSGFPLAGRLLEMKIYHFLSDSEGVTIKAGTLGLSGGKKEPYASIRETWSKRAQVLHHEADLKACIEKQSKLSC
jgi:hypothetical protein